MNLKNKISAITAAAMLAFAGVGYAAWTFNNSVDQSVTTGETFVTSAINAKNVVLSGDTTLYLVLDQAEPYWTTAVTNGSKPTKLSNGKITVTPSYDLSNQNDAASWTYTITGTMTVDPEIENYVNATGFGSSSALTGTVTAAGGTNQITAVDFNLPTLAYKGNKPSTYTEYQAMTSAVANKHITFTFNCTFVED